jgi:hypothetical protein
VAEDFLKGFYNPAHRLPEPGTGKPMQFIGTCSSLKKTHVHKKHQSGPDQRFPFFSHDILSFIISYQSAGRCPLQPSVFPIPEPFTIIHP